MQFFLSFLIAPIQAFALEERSVVLTTGIRIPFTELIQNVTGFLAVSISGICTLLFLVGASMLTVSVGDQTKKDNAKKLMISALGGLAIVLSSYAIIRTVLYFLYEGSA
jgi:uncharacterized membrane protein